MTSAADRGGKSNMEQREGERGETVEAIMMSVTVGVGIQSSREGRWGVGGVWYQSQRSEDQGL